VRLLLDAQIALWATIGALLVAQAIAEPLLLTADRALAVYGDAVMVV
jgi:hypothetical protein